MIAVIDDEGAVRTALRRLLESAGMKVETFCGGGDFLASLGTHRPDCAVLDLQMPDVSGSEVLAQLRKMRADVPVVVITGQDSPDAKTLAMSGGASAFLRKPVMDHILLAAIAAALSNTSPRS